MTPSPSILTENVQFHRRTDYIPSYNVKVSNDNIKVRRTLIAVYTYIPARASAASR